MKRIFIGWDSGQEIAYDVLHYSIMKNTRGEFIIQPLNLKDLTERYGFKRPLDPLQSTEFTYTRFLVPWLCNYDGIALFMDLDMLALGDVGELFDLDMEPYALRVVKHDHQPTETTKMGDLAKPQSAYPRKNWSSLMLMNCARLQVWTKETVEKESAAWLHRFEPISDEQIGDIDGEIWNVLDRYDAKTKLVHYTDGGPWLPGCENHPYGDVWLRAKEDMDGRK